MSGRVLLVHTHLLGVGHVARATRLAGAMVDAGLTVHGVHGGVPTPQIAFPGDVTHLPPVRADDATYATTLDGEGRPLGPNWLAKRRDALVAAAEAFRPDIVVVEAWPFGRRFMATEMVGLANHLRDHAPRTPMVTSVRDILQEKRKPGRAEEAAALVAAHLTRVLVHSDPAITRLDDTFPLAGDFADRTAYTGYVVTEEARPDEDGPDCDVLVSAGGGAFGGALMQLACAAAARRSDQRWRIVTGPNLPDDEFPSLDVSSNATLERHVTGLAAHMTRARVSISQCGYNTAMDTLAAARVGTRIVFVPHDTTGQTEQLRRAELFARAGRAACLPQSKASVEALLAAIDAAPDASALPAPKTDGAAETARIVAELIANGAR